MNGEVQPSPCSATRQRRVLLAFAALAVLAGPVASFIANPLGIGGQYLTPMQTTLADALAGAVLLAWAGARGVRLPRGPALVALLGLLAPQWLSGLLSPPIIRGVPALHETPWGVAFMVALAAPLWLALLSALQLVRDEAPRAVAGAAIVGIGAFCLSTPGGAYSVTLREIPVAALQMLLGVLAVFSWAYASPRLAETGSAAAAGCFLLLTALGQLLVAGFDAGDPPSPFSLRETAVPLLLTILVGAASWWLWFWLLKRMSLAAFGMRALAMWTASILPGLFLYGLQSWRIDLAVPIALAALAVALRARAADEQPLALGLESP